MSDAFTTDSPDEARWQRPNVTYSVTYENSQFFGNVSHSMALQHPSRDSNYGISVPGNNEARLNTLLKNSDFD
jgi:hypothetical protein